MNTVNRLPIFFKRRLAFAALVLAFAIGAVIAGAPSALMAAPPKKDCSDNTEYPDAFARVKCRHDAVSDQLAYTADEAFAPGTELHGRVKPSRLAHIGDSGQRGKRAKDKRTPADFKKMAKSEVRGNRKGGHLVPLTDFDDVIPPGGDGICDYEQEDPSNAQCAAIELDEFGDPQACNPKKKNKGKGKPGSDKFAGLECDLAFDPEEAESADEELEMEQAAEQLEATFGAVEDDLVEMNEHLDNVNATLPAFAGFAQAAAADPCSPPQPTPGLSEAAAALRGLVAAAQGASAIADSASGQTVVVLGSGGNGRAFATIANAASMVLELAYITLDEIVSAETSALQAATMACVVQVAGQVAALQALMMQQHGEIMANDDANTAAIQTRLNEVEAELSRLLNTPQGQRDNFPVK
jgi:hypothetical protein